MQHCLISKDIRMIRNFKCACTCACLDLKVEQIFANKLLASALLSLFLFLFVFVFLLFCLFWGGGIPKSCTNRKTGVVQHRRSFRRIAPPLFFFILIYSSAPPPRYTIFTTNLDTMRFSILVCPVVFFF